MKQKKGPAAEPLGYQADDNIITKKTKAVLYLRYSSQKQNEQSIEGQDRICRDYCRSRDIVIVDTYIDRAKSASHDINKRTEFQRMIKNAKKGTFDIVVVYKLDRFARSRYDSAVYKKKLKECGVKVVSATEAVPESPEGLIMEGLLEGMAEYYSAELSQKVRRGIRESVGKRRHLGGVAPLGLMNVDGKLVEDPTTIHIVREAFRLADEGVSYAVIARILNERGYRTRKGKPFGRSSLRTVLRSKRYIGYYCYDGIEIPDQSDPVVDPATFWRVQEALETMGNRKRHSNKADNYLLTGKLFCGNCGEAMLGESGKGSKGKTYRYYKCFGQKKGSGCSKKPIRKEVLEAKVVQMCQDMLTDERIDYLVSKIAEILAEREPDTKTAAMEKEIAENVKQLDALTQVVMSGNAPRSIIAKMTELEARQDSLQEELAIARAQEVPLSADDARFYLQQLKTNCEDVPGGGARLIQTFVDKVYLYDDPDLGETNTKIKVVFTLDGAKSSEIAFDGPPLSTVPNPKEYLVSKDGHIWFVIIRDLGEI